MFDVTSDKSTPRHTPYTDRRTSTAVVTSLGNERTMPTQTCWPGVTVSTVSLIGATHIPVRFVDEPVYASASLFSVKELGVRSTPPSCTTIVSVADEALPGKNMAPSRTVNWRGRGEGALKERRDVGVTKKSEKKSGGLEVSRSNG